MVHTLGLTTVGVPYIAFLAMRGPRADSAIPSSLGTMPWGLQRFQQGGCLADRKLTRLLMPGLSLGLLGCVPVHSAGSLPGRYVAVTEGAVTTLTVEAGGSFQKTYVSDSGLRRECTGIWAWSGKQHRVTFRNFLSPVVVARNMAPGACDGSADLPAMRDKQGVSLEDDPDEESHNFRKQP